MRKPIAQQTFLLLLMWLCYGNFNIAAACENHPDGLVCSATAAGKGMESHYSLPAFAHAIGTDYRIKKVVLDAGHGGKDPGCIGSSSKEKHNALAIVLKLGALINTEYPEVEVIYTRETDVFIELNERAAIANRNNADLFVSVHCNAISLSNVYGAETYVMGLHTAKSNLEVAKRENASIFFEDNYKKNYGGYDPNSAEAHIFGSVWQSAYLEQSILFASYTQQYAKQIAKRKDRGVKQAGFIVLHQTAMPSVLVEAGFLTNRTEEKFIASAEGQTQMADAIFEAFRAYKAKMEGQPLGPRINTSRAQLAAKGLPSKPIKQAAKTPLPAPVKPVQKPKQAQPITVAQQKTVPPPPTQHYKPATPTANQYADEIPLPVYSSQSRAISYRIYLISWPNRLDKNTGNLSLLSDVKEEQSGGQFHYFTGTFKSRSEAEKMLPELINLGFRTAKIIQDK